MKYILIALLTFGVISGCKAGEVFLSLGVGYDQHVLPGNNPMAVLRLEYLIDKKWSVEWNHTSSIMDGKPWNNHREDVSDQLSIIRRFKVW